MYPHVHETVSSWKAEARVNYRIQDCKTQPTHVPSCGLWMYGNLDLLRCPLAHAHSVFDESLLYDERIFVIEREAEELVLSGKVLVCGIHNQWHQKAAVVPLRWGAPRIVVMSGGFEFHLGKELDHEPFRTARLWRYEWDRHSDLAISRRAPSKLPTYSLRNPTVDRLIRSISSESLRGLPFVSRQSCLLL